MSKTEKQPELSPELKLIKKIEMVKKEVGVIVKDDTNPFHKSKYFDINSLLRHLEPLLEKYGLLCLQPIIDGKVMTVIIDAETGSERRSEMSLPDLQDPQRMGSAITYYRRYTLQSFFALQAEDDDGNHASPAGAFTTPKKDPQPAPAPKPVEVKKLSAQQFKLAMESDIKGIEATLKHIKDKKIQATSNQFNKLTIQLEKLTQIQTIEKS